MTLVEYKKWYWEKFSNAENFSDNKILSQLDLCQDYMKMSFSLYPFQIPAAFAVARFDKVLYTDDMGLGKTPTVIAAMSDMYKHGRRKFLVVVLASILSQWEDSFSSFSSFGCVKCQGTKQQRQAAYEKFYRNENADVLLLSYNSLILDIDVISRLNYDVAIYDEADYFKSPKSKAFQVALKSRSKAKQCCLITGTPVSGKLEDSFAFIHVLTNGYYSVNRLTSTFCELEQIKVPVFNKINGSRRNIHTWVISKYKNVDKFKELFDSFTFGRTIEQTGTKMPEISVFIDYIPKTDTLIRYEKLTLAGTFVEPSRNRIKLNGLQKISYLHRGFHSLKMLYPDLKSYVNPKLQRLWELLDFYGKEQVVIFSNYKQIPSEIQESLEDRGGCSVVTGDVTGNSRARTIEQFKDGTNQYCIISMAGYAGLSFPKCRHMICLDVIYNEAKSRQIQRRICRKDSIYDKVDVTYIMYKDSIDTVAWELLEKKGRLIDFMQSPNEADNKLLHALERAPGIGINKLKK